MTQHFDHIFVDNQAAKTLVLLHGTGGTKSDFLFLDAALHHTYNLLGLQGNVMEDGMSRFFRRTAPGVFDQENIRDETLKLHEFLAHWLTDHHQTAADLSYCGYSNGANMILALLFYYPDSIETAVLLHPMLPFSPEALVLADKNLFVSHGQHDPMVTTTEQTKLTELLQDSGARVVANTYAGGHAVSRQEMSDAIAFLRQ